MVVVEEMDVPGYFVDNDICLDVDGRRKSTRWEKKKKEEGENFQHIRKIIDVVMEEKWFVVKETLERGRGVFATQMLPPNKPDLQYSGNLITRKEGECVHFE